MEMRALDLDAVPIASLGGLKDLKSPGMYEQVYGRFDIQGGWLNKPVEVKGKTLAQII